jgi:hypothetical protein
MVLRRKLNEIYCGINGRFHSVKDVACIKGHISETPILQRDGTIEAKGHYSTQIFRSITLFLLLLAAIYFKAIMDEHYNFADACE